MPRSSPFLAPHPSARRNVGGSRQAGAIQRKVTIRTPEMQSKKVARCARVDSSPAFKAEKENPRPCHENRATPPSEKRPAKTKPAFFLLIRTRFARQKSGLLFFSFAFGEMHPRHRTTHQPTATWNEGKAQRTMYGLEEEAADQGAEALHCVQTKQCYCHVSMHAVHGGRPCHFCEEELGERVRRVVR